MVILGGGAVSYERGIPVVDGDPRTYLNHKLNGAEMGFRRRTILVRINSIIGMIWWTGLAPWEIEFPFPGSLISTFLWCRRLTQSQGTGGASSTPSPTMHLPPPTRSSSQPPSKPYTPKLKPQTLNPIP